MGFFDTIAEKLNKFNAALKIAKSDDSDEEENDSNTKLADLRERFRSIQTNDIGGQAKARRMAQISQSIQQGQHLDGDIGGEAKKAKIEEAKKRMATRIQGRIGSRAWPSRK